MTTLAELTKEQIEHFPAIKNSVLSRLINIFIYLNNSALSYGASNAIIKIQQINPKTTRDLALFCGHLKDLRDNISSAFEDRISRSKAHYSAAIVERHKSQEIEFFQHIDNLISRFKKYE